VPVTVASKSQQSIKRPHRKANSLTLSSIPTMLGSREPIIVRHSKKLSAGWGNDDRAVQKVTLLAALTCRPLFTMQEKLEAAIEVLKQRLAEQERKMGDTKRLINELCEEASIPVLYPDIDIAGSQAGVASITGDTFYGDPSVTTQAAPVVWWIRAVRPRPML